MRWKRDGSELFYVALDGRLMSVPIVVSRDGGIDPLAPVPLFATRMGYPAQGINSWQYAVSNDGQRFLVNTLVEADASCITVLLNWRGDHAR